MRLGAKGFPLMAYKDPALAQKRSHDATNGLGFRVFRVSSLPVLDFRCPTRVPPAAHAGRVGAGMRHEVSSTARLYAHCRAAI